MEESAHRMDVDIESAADDPVLESPVAGLIVFRQNIIADETAGFAFSRNGSDPVERQIFRLMIAVVFDMVPDPVKDFQQFAADRLVVRNGVAVAARLDPVVAAFLVRRMMPPSGETGFVRKTVSPFRRSEFDRMTDVGGTEIKGRSQRAGVGFFRSQSLVEFRTALPAHAEFGAGEKSDRCVTRAVCHRQRENLPDQIGSEGACRQLDDRGPCFFNGIYFRIQQKGQILFLSAELFQHVAVITAVAVGIFPFAFQPDVFDDAGFACIAVAPVAAAADQPTVGFRIAFAAGGTAEHGPVLDQNCFQSQAGGSYGGGRSSHSAAGHNQIDGQFPVKIAGIVLRIHPVRHVLCSHCIHNRNLHWTVMFSVMI